MDNESLFGEISFSPLESRGVLISSSSSSRSSLPSMCVMLAIFPASSRTRVTVQTSLSQGSVQLSGPASRCRCEMGTETSSARTQRGEVSLCQAETRRTSETFENAEGVGGKAEYKIILMLWPQMHATQDLPGCKPALAPSRLTGGILPTAPDPDGTEAASFPSAFTAVKPPGFHQGSESRSLFTWGGSLPIQSPDSSNSSTEMFPSERHLVVRGPA